MKINKTNCYCFLLTIFTFANIVTIGCNISRINTLNDRCKSLEKQIDTIKNEAVSDYQSYIQLHYQDNK